MYIPESYWDQVAEKIRTRKHSSLIAGDDDPYYKYKRRKFVKLLDSISFEGKKVIEIGSGPGGNLSIIAAKNPKELWGVDVSQNMIDLSAKFLKGARVNLKKTNGTELEFPDKHFDIAFTSTVLQHNTNEAELEKLISEICRIT